MLFSWSGKLFCRTNLRSIMGIQMDHTVVSNTNFSKFEATVRCVKALTRSVLHHNFPDQENNILYYLIENFVVWVGPSSLFVKLCDGIPAQLKWKNLWFFINMLRGFRDIMPRTKCQWDKMPAVKRPGTKCRGQNSAGNNVMVLRPLSKYQWL